MTKKSSLKFVKHYWKQIKKEHFLEVGTKKKGLYALLKRKKRKGKEHFDVVYLGMSSSTIRGRLRSHKSSKLKGEEWDYFSVFELRNFSRQKIKELEGLFLEIYGKDTHANFLNRQKRFKEFNRVCIRNKDLERMIKETKGKH